MFQLLDQYWHEITAWTAILDMVLAAVTIAWILTIKKDSMSAIAWCLLVFFLPFVGILLFLLFGYQHVHRPLARKVKHRRRFRESNPAGSPEATRGLDSPGLDASWQGMGHLAQRFDAFPVTERNRVTFYYEGQPAYDAKLEAIRSARHHIHLEYFIFQPDDSGRLFLHELVRKARQGV